MIDQGRRPVPARVGPVPPEPAHRLSQHRHLTPTAESPPRDGGGRHAAVVLRCGPCLSPSPSTTSPRSPPTCRRAPSSRSPCAAGNLADDAPGLDLGVASVGRLRGQGRPAARRPAPTPDPGCSSAWARRPTRRPSAGSAPPSSKAALEAGRRSSSTCSATSRAPTGSLPPRRWPRAWSSAPTGSARTRTPPRAPAGRHLGGRQGRQGHGRCRRAGRRRRRLRWSWCATW